MSGKRADERDLIKIVDKIAENQQINDIKITKKYPSNTGDGYLGVITFLDLEGTKNNNKITLNVVIKSAPKEVASRKEIDIRDAFLIEEYMYRVVLQEYTKFQEEYNIKNPFKSFAKCLASNDKEFEEIIAFENLKTQGFEMYKKGERMNKGHLIAVMKEYGKYHALSLAYKKIYPNNFEKIKKRIERNCVTKYYEENSGIAEKMTEKICIHLRNKGKAYLADKLYSSVSQSEEKVFKDMVTVDEYSILSHGDAWANNFMFRYNIDDKSVPVEVKFLDWQCSLYTTPALDLGYFFWTSAQPEYYKEYESFLKVYHNSLCEHLACFNLHGEVLFPFEELLKQWEKGVRYGLLSALFIFKALIVDPDEAPDITAASDNGQNFVETFCAEFSNYDQYLEMCEGLIEFIYNIGYLKT